MKLGPVFLYPSSFQTSTMPLFRCLIKDGAEFPANTNPVGVESSCLRWSCLGCVVSGEFVLMGHFSLSRLAGAAAVKAGSSALRRGMASADVVVKKENQVLTQEPQDRMCE